MTTKKVQSRISMIIKAVPCTGGRNRSIDVENGLVRVKGGRRGGMN